MLGGQVGCSVSSDGVVGVTKQEYYEGFHLFQCRRVDGADSGIAAEETLLP